MNCKDKGYEVGQVFEVIGSDGDLASLGSILILKEDDRTGCPSFWLAKGESTDESGWFYYSLNDVKRIWPPEEKSTMVTVICEGKETEISRESAEKLNLV